jgi:HK97 family phage major capsid protein
MTIQTRARGIVSVEASTSAADLLAELETSFEDFKSKRETELTEIRRELDAINTRQAGYEVGPGSGTAPIASKARAEFLKFMRNGSIGDSMMPRSELSTDSGPDGGFTVPKEIDNRIHDQLIDISPLRRLASTVQTNSSDYHKLVGRRGATSGWVGERETRSETDTPALGDVSPPQGEIYAYAGKSRDGRSMTASSFSNNGFARTSQMNLSKKNRMPFLAAMASTSPEGSSPSIPTRQMMTAAPSAPCRRSHPAMRAG